MSTALPLDDVIYLTGNADALQAAYEAPALPVFSNEALSLLQDLSRALRALPDCRDYPDLASFAFWCRRSSLLSLRTSYEKELLLGRGLAMHITPGNVPLNFAYSLTAGLLAGNANAVRLPSGDFPQTGLFCWVLDQLIAEKHPEMAPYAVCFRCGHDSPLLEEISGRCAVRVIWGGDETIAQIRRMAVPPRTVELTFADRYSLGVFDAEAYLAYSEKDLVVERFFQDAYWSDQLACTAPKAMLWLGQAGPEAGADFRKRLSALAQKSYSMPDLMAVKKREAAFLLAAQCPEAKLVTPEQNAAVFVRVPKLEADYFFLCPGSGFFLECFAENLEALLPAAGEKCQTVVGFGLEKQRLESFLTLHRPRGIDRVVPPGRSMDFDLHWDGYDLIRAMSRGVSVELPAEYL